MNQLCLELSRLPRARTGDLDWPFAFELVDAFLAGGGEYFETGYALLSGRSETVVRRAVAERHPRESFRVMDKLPLDKLQTGADCERIFAEQLEKSGLGYFDTYLLDWLNRDRFETAKALKALEFLESVKADGRAKRIGIAYYGDPETLKTVLEAYPAIEAVQLQVNYMDWDSEYLQVGKCCALAASMGKTVLGFDPAKNNVLTTLHEAARKFLPAGDASPEDWARRFARSREGVEFVSECVADTDTVRELVKPSEPLTEAEAKSLRAVAKAQVNNCMTIHCVGCNACLHCCPREIASPDYFHLYNEYARVEKDLAKLKPFYEGLVRERGRASDCVHCGSCENHCPQRLLVTKWLFKVATTFE